MAPACAWVCMAAVLLAVVFAIQGMPFPMAAALAVAFGAFLLAIESADDEEPGE